MKSSTYAVFAFGATSKASKTSPTIFGDCRQTLRQPVHRIHEDDFDGKPETIQEFRHGKLAIVERDPQERGYIDIVEYYDDSGKPILREVRKNSACQTA
jgi:hypothetical protein